MENCRVFLYLLTVFFVMPQAYAQQVEVPGPAAYEYPFDEDRGVLSYAPLLNTALKSVVKVYRLEQSDSSDGLVLTSTGSGVVMDRKRRLIITNEHVTSKADRIQIEFDADRWAWGTVLAESSLVDIAVVQLDDFVPTHEATFVDTNTIQVGDLAFAAGFPKNLAKTLTTGVVSGLERRGLGGQDGSIPGRPKIEDFIQTDAAINSGNSGGALLDSSGRVIGINTFIYKKDQAEGLGFAIPSNVALNVANRLLRGSAEQPAYFGATIETLGISDIDRLNVDVNQGVVLEEVELGSPAYEAGLRANDVVVGADNRQISDVYQFANFILLTDANVPSNVYFRRGPERKVATVMLRSLTESRTNIDIVNRLEVQPSKTQSTEILLHGATLVDSASRGWVVGNVRSGSRAERKGVSAGDRIVSINGKRMNSISSVEAIVEKANSSSSAISIERNGQKFNIIL